MITPLITVVHRLNIYATSRPLGGLWRLSLETLANGKGRSGLPAVNDRLANLSDVRVIAPRVTADYGVCHSRTWKSSERRHYDS
jgi:hypothetical protein